MYSARGLRAFVCSALVAGACFPCGAQDYHNGHTDVFKLDIYGVRLKMTANEVLSVLHSKFGAKAKIDIGHNLGLFGKRPFVDKIQMQHGDYNLEIRLAESAPDSKAQPEQAWSVNLESKTYSFPGDDGIKHQDEVEQEFINNVLAKYPAPDGHFVCTQQGCGHLEHGNPVWCARPTGNTYEPCPQFEPWMKEGTYYGDSGGGIGFALTLDNQRATQDAEYYYRTHQPDQHLSSSPF